MMVSTFRETATLAALLFAPFAASSPGTNPKRVPKDAVLLSKVESLTLRDGRKTTSRRVAPVPQLECVGPEDVCKLYTVDTMRCTNEGADYDAENIQWSCKASLPEQFKLGSTEVVCEGYQNSDDPYILKGSCAVEYRLLLTDKGETRYGKSHDPTPGGEDGSETSGSTKLGGLLFMAIFIMVLFVIVRGIWSRWSSDPPRLGVGRGTGGGGGGGGDNDPPPPYADDPPTYTNTPRKQSASTSKTQASSSRSQTGSAGTRQTPQQNTWRPGFWTGAAAGAAGGAYAASRPASRATTPQTQPPVQQQSQPRVQRQEQPESNWFGSPRQPTRSSYTPPRSDPAPSFSTRHESTGFGGTRRR